MVPYIASIRNLVICSFIFRSLRESDLDPFRLMSVRLENYDGHTGSVKGILPIDHFETSFLSYGKDHTVKIWSIANQRVDSSNSGRAVAPSFTYHLHKKGLNGIFYSSYLTKVVSCDGNIHVSSTIENWSSDFGHAETGNGAKKRVVLRRGFFCSNFKVE